MLLSMCIVVCHAHVGVEKTNLRRLLRTVEALTDLGPELTAERDFTHTAQVMLATLMEAAAAREGALFTFSDKPSMLSSIASQGYTMLPEPAIMPLLPRHAHALSAARGPVVLNESTYDVFFSANGIVTTRFVSSRGAQNVSFNCTAVNGTGWIG